MTPPRAPSLPPAADPFAIGWRDVPYTLPDGRTAYKQVPLTLQDALHPQEGDTIVQNTVHDRDWTYLKEVFRSRVAADPHALVLGDCKVLWEDGVHHSPDIAVILGVREVRDFYGQFDVAAEGVRPQLIVEVVSASTRPNDVVDKVEDYHRYRVPVYVLLDREDDDVPARLIAYQYARRRYRPLPLADDGRLWLKVVNLYLGVRDNRVVAYDGDTGEEFADYPALTAARAVDRARAAEAEARADAALARVQELEAALRRLQPPSGP